MMIARCTAESLSTGVHGGNGGMVEALGGESTFTGGAGGSTLGATGACVTI